MATSREPGHGTDFAARLTGAMEARGMTRPDLVTASGVSKQAVSNWVSGRHEPNLSQVRKVARALGVSVSYLAGEEVGEPRRGGSAAADELVRRIGDLGLGDAALSIKAACPDLLDLLVEAERLAAQRGR